VDIPDRTASVANGVGTPQAYPEIPDLAAYKAKWGSENLKRILQKALAETKNVKGAMALLGVPEDQYAAFRKWLQRLDLSVRDIAKSD
jgi:hypothetical protein